MSPASLPIAAVASGSNDKIRATLLGMEPKSGLPRVMGMDRDTNEVGELYARTCAPLIGLLASIGGSRSDAEEVAQDAFVKLLGRWESVREYDDPEAWLRTVAVRILISRHRRSQVASLGLKRLAGNRVAEQPALSPESIAIAQALESLPMKHRAVVLLHHVLDLPIETVATEMQIPVGTVKSRLARARAALAPMLRDEEMIDND